MSEADIQDCEDCVAPAEAFGVVASETRLEILEALWEAESRPVRFSALRREVGMRDSAQFNYHLDKLRDHFVTKAEAGYDLTHAGKTVIRAVLAGEFNENPTLDPFGVPGECADCGGDLSAHYADEKLSIECDACSALHGRYSFPPGGLADRTNEEIARAFDQRVRHLHCLAADGVCPECNGSMDTRIVEDDDVLGLSVRVDHVCRRCDHHLHSSVGLSLLDQSDVVTAHRAHGIDLGTRPYWTLDWCVCDEYTEVRSEDPWRIRVRLPLADLAEAGTVEADGDTPRAVGDGGRYPSVVCGEGSPPPAVLDVTLDDQLNVVAIEATPQS
jgi:DNA-binding transcriptional ArsR family regulator